MDKNFEIQKWLSEVVDEDGRVQIRQSQSMWGDIWRMCQKPIGCADPKIG